MIIPNTHNLDFTSSEGTPMRAILNPGSRNYRGEITGEVRFFDRRYDFTPDGQRLYAYYAAQMIDHTTGGLSLDASAPEWSISPDVMAFLSPWTSHTMNVYAAANGLVWRTLEYTRVLVPAEPGEATTPAPSPVKRRKLGTRE